MRPPQRVRLNGQLGRDPVMSDEIIVNIGAPLGCFLSPILFSVYTNAISCNNSLLTLIKYADDMALIGCLNDDFSLSQYFLQIDSLNCQFKSSFLELNIAKTKELIFGKGKAENTPTPIYIDNQEVDIVSSLTYLGTFIDTNLTLCDHVDYIYKKTQQRLYLLRKLQSFDASKHILELVYRGLIESILSLKKVTCYGNINKTNRANLSPLS